MDNALSQEAAKLGQSVTTSLAATAVAHKALTGTKRPRESTENTGDQIVFDDSSTQIRPESSDIDGGNSSSKKHKFEDAPVVPAPLPPAESNVDYLKEKKLFYSALLHHMQKNYQQIPIVAGYVPDTSGTPAPIPGFKPLVFAEFASSMPFQDGEGTLSLDSQLKDIFLSYVNGNQPGKKKKILCLWGPPGTGISRRIDELALRTAAWSHENNFGPVIAYNITLGNSEQIKDTVCDRKEAELEIVIRMLYSRVKDKDGLFWSDFERDMQQFFKTHGTRFATVSCIMDFVCQYWYKQELGQLQLARRRQSKFTLLHQIGIDEFRAVHGNREEQIETLRFLVEMTGEIQSRQTQPAFVLFSGTGKTMLSSAIQRSQCYEPHSIDFQQLFSPGQVRNVISGLINGGQLSKVLFAKWEQDELLQSYLRRLGGHPRALEKFLRKVAASKSTSLTEHMLDKVYQEVLRYFPISAVVALAQRREALRHVFFDKMELQSIRFEKQVFLDHLISCGVLARVEGNEKLSIPLVVLPGMLEGLEAEKDLTNEWTLTTTSALTVDGIPQWELVCQHFLLFKFLLYIELFKLYDNSLPLRALFPEHCAIFGPNTSSLEVCLSRKPESSNVSYSIDKDCKDWAKVERDLLNANVVLNGHWQSPTNAGSGGAHILCLFFSRHLLQAKCKFQDVDAELDYSRILKEIQKNEDLVKAWNKKRASNKQITNVNLILTTRFIKNIPENTNDLPDRTIIVHQPHIESFLGPLSRLKP